MSLSSILDDIADKPPVVEVSTQGVTCLEHLAGLPVLLERVKSVDAALHTKRLLHILLQSGAISKASALEAFTMLPLANDESMLLTQAPTEHNHKLVAKAASNAFSNPEEAGSLVTEVLEMIAKTIESSKTLNELCSHYRTEIQKHLDRLTAQAPMVIDGTTSINLLTADAWIIANIDTHTLGYNPYEGVLDAKFRAITTHPVMTSLLENGSVFTADSGVPTLANVASYVCNQAKIMLDQQQGLVQTQQSLKSYLVTGDKPYADDTGVGHVLDTLGQIKAHEKLFTGQGCFACSVLDCLSTLV